VSADESDPLSRMLELSAVFMLMTFVVFVGYGLFAASVRDHVISRPRVLAWIRRTFAAAFAALGAKLAFRSLRGRRAGAAQSLAMNPHPDVWCSLTEAPC
jgi:threonine/homoserine/homoserine lactone efflux protein